MAFLLNCWHVAGWSKELEDRSSSVIARTLCDVPVAIFRLTGTLVALLDRCPHRFAPLSHGSVVNGAVQCAYHGLAFGRDGRCARNPHGPISAGLAARSFPVVESYGVIWIWLGDPLRADPALIPDVSFLSAQGQGSAYYAYDHGKANHLLFMDNLMDLCHVNFLHPSSAGDSSLVGAEQIVTEDERTVKIRWTSKEHTASPHEVELGLFAEHAHITRYAQVHWHPGNIMKTINSAASHDDDECLYLGAHIITPETEYSSHYFYAITRNFCLDDPRVSAGFETTARQVIEEDIRMLDGVQQRMGPEEFFAAKPRLLRTDEAIVRVRRKLESMIAAGQ